MAYNPSYIQTAEEEAYYAEQQKKLEAKGVHMPKPLGYTPYLKERKTGFVHPYTAAMAARSDLVIGCYNEFGSMNPEDDTGYNPTDADVVPVRTDMASTGDGESGKTPPKKAKVTKPKKARAPKKTAPVADTTVGTTSDTVTETTTSTDTVTPGSDDDIAALARKFTSQME